MPITPDQKLFRHDYNLALEFFAESLFGPKYHKSVDRIDIGFWKKFYIDAFEVLDASIFNSIGWMDVAHREDVQDQVTHTLAAMRQAKTKDALHGWLIVGLFRLVFLLLGRLPYSSKGKKRSLATFRTLTYCQTEEQLSWLLQGYIQQRPAEHGFGDSFDADFAFLEWTREKKLQRSDRSAYVTWVRERFPETLAKFR